MFHLRTLGSLDLTGPDGRSLEAILAQPKRALLLAYLSAATPRGFHRRDVLVALFWPELDTERARGALRKALHYLRASLGDVVITRGDEVTIDTGSFDCDIPAFESAVADRRFAEAIALYRGEFLPGVFARNAPDVERWIAGERGRLRDMAMHAAWTLAESSASTDAALAVHYSALATSFTPDDEEALVRRMLLLDRVGSRAAARRAYEDFAVALATRFPGEVPSNAARALRDRLAEPQDVELTQAGIVHDSGRIEVVPQPPNLAPHSIQDPSAAVKRRSRSTRAVIACAALATVALTTWGVRRLVAPSEAASHAADASSQLIAVMPFTIRGGQLDYLRDGMVDLLSINLDGAGGIRVVEPIALLDAVRHDSSGESEFVRARSTARRFGAGRFTLGTIVDAAGQLTGRVSLYATADSSMKPLAVATAYATEGQVASLVDALTRQLVSAMLDGPEPRLAQLATRTTTSLAALKSYLRGSQAMRSAEYAEAAQAFRVAVDADTTFALAYYGLSMAIGWATEGVDRAASIAAVQAVHHSRGLSAHDSLLLVAHRDYWTGRMLQGEEEYRRLVAAYPDDAEAWHELGEVIFHSGAISGHSMSDARDAFTRASAVDALHMSALVHLARIAATTFDTVAIDSLARGVARTFRDPRAEEILTLRTFVSGDSAERVRAIAAAATRSDREVWTMARDLASYAGAWPGAEAVALHLTTSARVPATRAVGWATIARIRAAAGRPAAARAAIARCAALDTGLAAYMRGYLALLDFLPASSADLAAAREGLTRWPNDQRNAPNASEMDMGAGEPYRIGHMLIAAIDVRSGRLPPKGGRPDSISALWGVVMRDPATVAGRADALSASERRSARQRADVIGTRWSTVQFGLPRSLEHVARFARADLLHEAGDESDALRWFGSFPAYGQDDVAYRAVAARGRAGAEDALGHTKRAARAYAEAAWLWQYAEAPLQPQVREWRARAERLRKTAAAAN